jgi:hypothetical protein
MYAGDDRTARAQRAFLDARSERNLPGCLESATKDFDSSSARRQSLPPPAGPVIVARPVIIAWSVITAIIVGPTMIIGSAIIGSAIIGTGIVPTVVGVIVTEIIEYKRKRERDSEAYTVGAGRQRGEDQRGSKEQKDQRLFHLRCTSGEYLQLIRNQMKGKLIASGIERHRAA